MSTSVRPLSPDEWRRKKRAEGEVRAGPITGLGLPQEEIERLGTEGGLANQINVGFQMARDPAMEKAVRPALNRERAPGLPMTVADVAMSNMAAPFSDKLAEAGTEGALRRYSEGEGADPSKHAETFGHAAALGAVAGNVGLSALTPAAKLNPGTTLRGKVAIRAAEGGAQNAAIGGAGGLVAGDDEGGPGLAAAGRQALEQGAIGTVLGGSLEGLRSLPMSPSQWKAAMGKARSGAVGDIGESGSPLARETPRNLLTPTTEHTLAQEGASRASFPITALHVAEHAEAKGISVSQAAENLRREGYAVTDRMADEAHETVNRPEPYRGTETFDDQRNRMIAETQRPAKPVYRAVSEAELEAIKKSGVIKSNSSMALPVEGHLGLTGFASDPAETMMYAQLNRQRGGKSYIVEVERSPDMRSDYTEAPTLRDKRAELAQELDKVKATLAKNAPDWESAGKFREWVATNEKEIAALDSRLSAMGLPPDNLASAPKGARLPYHMTPQEVPATRILKLWEVDESGALVPVDKRAVGLQPEGRLRNRPGILDPLPGRREGTGTPYTAPTDAGADPRMYNVPKLGLSDEGEAVFRQIVGTHGEKKRVSWDETKAIAAELGIDPAKMLLKPGDWSGAEALAARDVISQSAERIVTLGKTAADPQAKPGDVEAAQREIDRLTSDIGTLAGRFTKERSRAGRDLNALKIIASKTMDPAVWLIQAQRIKGAIPLTPEESIQITRLTGANDRAALQSMVAKLSHSTPLDKLITIWKAGLLTAPATHVVNVSSNLSMAAMETSKEPAALVADRLISIVRNRRDATGKLRRTKDPSFRGLVVNQAKGLGAGVKAAGQVIRTGIAPEDAAKWDLRRTNFDSAFWQGYTDAVFRTLSAEDQLSKGMAAAREVTELSRLQARAEGLKPGTDAFTKRVADLYAKPPDDIMIRAIETAEYATFQSTNKLAEGITAFKAKQGPVGRNAAEFVMPFVRTPTNVAARLIDYSPLGLYKVHRAFAKELTAPDQKKLAEDLGRAVTGSSLVLLGFMLAREGKATGAAPRGDTAERNMWELEEKQPNSVRMGGKWVNVSRISPPGMLVALGAQMYDVSQKAESKMGAVAGALYTPARVALDQSFLKGVSGALEVANDPARYGERFAQNTVGSLIPAGVAAAARATDPTEREPKGVAQTLMSRTPGLSQKVPSRLNAFGGDVKRGGGPVSRVLSPAQYRTANDDPLFKKMRELSIDPPGGVAKTFKLDGETLKRSPEDIRRVIREMGPQAERELRALLNEPWFAQEDAAVQAKEMESIISRARRESYAKEKERRQSAPVVRAQPQGR